MVGKLHSLAAGPSRLQDVASGRVTSRMNEYDEHHGFTLEDVVRIPRFTLPCLDLDLNTNTYSGKIPLGPTLDPTNQTFPAPLLQGWTRYRAGGVDHSTSSRESSVTPENREAGRLI